VRRAHLSLFTNRPGAHSAPYPDGYPTKGKGHAPAQGGADRPVLPRHEGEAPGHDRKA